MNYQNLIQKRNIYQQEKPNIPELTISSYEQAFEIEYSLVDTTSGASYKKTEVYYNDLENQRTSAFLSYLANNGVQVETTDDFVGIKETLQFAYITSKGKRFLNITHRDFVSKPATVQPTPQPKTGK